MIPTVLSLDSELLVNDPGGLGQPDDAIVTLPHPPDGAADSEGLVGPRHPAGGRCGKVHTRYEKVKNLYNV